jgi:hypothetical protein
MCATWSVHLILPHLYRPIYIWLRLRNFLHSSGTSCLLDQNILPNLCSPLDLRDQVPALRKTNIQHYASVYFNHYVFRLHAGREKILG